METLLLKYGYALLFGGVLVEGEAVLLVAAVLARRGFFACPRSWRWPWPPTPSPTSPTSASRSGADAAGSSARFGGHP